MSKTENKEEPLVSISCITYNHVNFIRQCIDGFLMQKTNFLFEVLIHDDASTDGTEEIIREYEIQYPDIIKPIYEKENQWERGRRGSRLFNFPRSRGKYIALCEGDDFWIDPLKLKKQVDFMEANPDYSMCFHNAIVYKTTTLGRSAFLFNNLVSDLDMTIENVVCQWLVPTASILFRKEFSDYPDWMVHIYSGDYALLLNLFTKGKIKYIDTISSVYRNDLTGSSVSATISSNLVRKHHILLLESFNAGTHKKYEEVVTNRVKKLRNDIALSDIIWKHKYYQLIFMLPHIWKSRLRILKYVLFKLKMDVFD